LGDVVTGVTTHDGRFDAGELKRWAQRAPTALVALVSTKPAPESEIIPKLITVDLQWVTYLLTRDTVDGKRGALAVELVEKLLRAVHRDLTWTDTDARQVLLNVRADNLYTGPLDQTGVSLWAVAWNQEYDLYSP
jgi:phage gp37-like protein